MQLKENWTFMNNSKSLSISTLQGIQLHKYIKGITVYSHYILCFKISDKSTC